MELICKGKSAEKRVGFTPQRVYCAGYAGRNQAKVREHIEELAKIGVPAPGRTPTVYTVSPYLLTNEAGLTVQGKQTSGEVEFVVYCIGSKKYIGVGSDHTDRELEKQTIARSKQVCVKPASVDVWDYDEVAEHWDSLILRSWITDERGRHLYQEGDLTALLPVSDLLAAISRETAVDLEGSAVFSGTVPAHGGFKFAKIWDLELEDTVLGRKLHHHYEFTVLEEEMKE